MVSGVEHPGRLHRSGTTVPTRSPSQTLPAPPCSRRRRGPIALVLEGHRAIHCSARIPCKISIKGNHQAAGFRARACQALLTSSIARSGRPPGSPAHLHARVEARQGPPVLLGRSARGILAGACHCSIAACTMRGIRKTSLTGMHRLRQCVHGAAACNNKVRCATPRAPHLRSRLLSSALGVLRPRHPRPRRGIILKVARIITNTGPSAMASRLAALLRQRPSCR